MYSNELICKIIEYINHNLDNEISMDDLSRIFFFNKFYIMKLFKKEIGLSIVTYINKAKIYSSLFEYKNNKSISAIAYRHGFSSLEYYSETFRKVMGVSPSKYKKFIMFTYPLKEEDYEFIQQNSFEIQSWSRSIQNYLEKRKPKKMMKKTLSIFK